MKQSVIAAAAAMSMVLLAPGALGKDKGLYIGGSLGAASVKQNGSDPDLGDFDIDESDFAYKLYAGWQATDLIAMEGGYIDLGSPSGGSVETDVDGWNIAIVLGIPVGPVRLFGKGGGVFWDADTKVSDVFDFNDDGSDWMAGGGLEFELGSFGVRGEVEYLDVLDGTWLYTVGATITF